MKPEIKRQLPKRITAEAAQNIGNRNEQQDYYIYSDLYDYNECDPGAIAVVTDGMGGYANGKAASKTAAEKFAARYKNVFKDNVNLALMNSMHYANESVSGLSDGGTTLVCAVIHAWRLYWLSVGDSRIYLYRNGILRKLNIEHNYKHRLIQSAETGEISFHQALTNKKRNALTSYIGMENITEYDYNDCEFPMLKKDKVLLCSDGLYKTLSDHEIEAAISSANYSFADEIVSRALSKRKQNQDNITAVVLNIE